MIDDLIDALLAALNDDEEDECPVKSYTLEFSMNNSKEDAKGKEEPVDKKPEKKVTTGAPPKYTLSFKDSDGKDYEFDGCSLTNDKEEKPVDRTVKLVVPKNFMTSAKFEYDSGIKYLDLDAAILFAFVRLMGEHAGLSGEALESFVEDYGAFLSVKLVDITKEFMIDKLTKELNELKGLKEE